MKLKDIKTEKDVRDRLEGYSEFEKAVYVATFRIPKGKVTTYGRIAKAIGKPGASRAVANTLHNNPLFPVVPCWRVVKNDGAFGGPADAAAGRRRRVIEDGVPVRDGKVVMTKDVVL
jgi:methylated-DNA-[protein]-cysteine S-methyltransferase